MQISINSLNTKKAVSKFLNKSEKTIDNYIKNKKLIENKHYFINENKRIEFIPFAIVEFRKCFKVPIEIIEEQKSSTVVISDTTQRILKNLV